MLTVFGAFRRSNADPPYRPKTRTVQPVQIVHSTWCRGKTTGHGPALMSMEANGSFGSTAVDPRLAREWRRWSSPCSDRPIPASDLFDRDTPPCGSQPITCHCGLVNSLPDYLGNFQPGSQRGTRSYLTSHPPTAL